MEFEKELKSKFDKSFYKIFDFYDVCFIRDNQKVLLPPSTLFYLCFTESALAGSKKSAPLCQFVASFKKLCENKENILRFGYDLTAVNLGAINDNFIGFYLYVKSSQLFNEIRQAHKDAIGNLVQSDAPAPASSLADSEVKELANLTSVTKR